MTCLLPLLLGWTLTDTPRTHVPSALWAKDGHVMSGEAATLALPVEMPAFFREASAQLGYLNYEPDHWRDTVEIRLDPALNAAFAPDHHVVLERMPAEPLDASDRFAFLAAVSASGLSAIETGLAHYRILELFQSLRSEFRLWRATSDPRTRGWIEQRILNDAGILGHYVADGANPHHTSMHFDGWVGPGAQSFPNAPNFHGRFEYEYVRTHVTLEDLRSAMTGREPRLLSEPRRDIVAFLRESHSHVRALYELDLEEPFGEGTRAISHHEFTVERLAAGAQMLRDLWWTAWASSASSEPPVQCSNGGPRPSDLEGERQPAAPTGAACPAPKP
jgi:hypothetical protein